jgi:hypothetical protein
MKARETPRWSKWRLMPRVRVWEATALSLNIEPVSINTNSQGWMGSTAFAEGPEFEDRLEVLSRNVAHNGAALIRQDVLPVPASSAEILLPAFVTWAVNVGWDLPPELAVLAPKEPPPKPEVSTRERDTLLKLIWGMAVGAYKYDPNAAKSDCPREIVEDCDRAGQSIDVDTVRKYLKDAKSRFGNG